MKTLYLLRHAKSSWDASAQDDHDRPLNARGLENAARMGLHMRKAGYAPALVLCSSARRTRETLAQIRPNLPGDCLIREERALYLGTAERMLRLLRETEDGLPSVLIIAHSPGTEHLAVKLSRSGGSPAEAARRAEIEEKFPTAALAVLRLPAGHWHEIAPGTGELADFVKPRDLSD
jgi:phosphohistidine phosphatase